MIVNLTPAEMQVAYMVAAQRQIMNVKVGAKDTYGAAQFHNAIALNMTGCAAEMAVAKGLNLFWSGSVGNYNASDVGGMVEVRSIVRPTDSLIIHDEDKDGLPYVLCHSIPNTFTFDLKGWIWGKQGKDRKFWRDPQGTNRHAYFVPQDELFRCEELKEQIHGYSFG